MFLLIMESILLIHPSAQLSVVLRALLVQRSLRWYVTRDLHFRMSITALQKNMNDHWWLRHIRTQMSESRRSKDFDIGRGDGNTSSTYTVSTILLSLFQLWEFSHHDLCCLANFSLLCYDLSSFLRIGQLHDRWVRSFFTCVLAKKSKTIQDTNKKNKETVTRKGSKEVKYHRTDTKTVDTGRTKQTWRF